VGTMLKGIADGKEKLEAMLKFVTAAQLRIASGRRPSIPRRQKRPAVDEAGSPR
jgi:hypothetical protein